VSAAAARLAVLGDPLRFTRSPDLHRAGLAALGLAGDSRALPTPVGALGGRLRALAEEGVMGLNLTHPLKEAALDHVSRVSEAARRARSINTLGWSAAGWWGDTTDGPGLLDLLASLGRDAARRDVVLLGAGGAARSLALALAGEGGSSLVVAARRAAEPRPAWRDLPAPRWVEWGSSDQQAALASATLVVHATPLAGETDDLPLDAIAANALALDLNYGAEVTPWVRRLRALGREAFDGLGLLVFQARRSLALWFSRPVPVDPLARAVGWPR
jgi:shikimate dehydrogenase